MCNLHGYLQKVGIPLTADQLMTLVSKLDKDGSGDIDFG